MSARVTRVTASDPAPTAAVCLPIDPEHTHSGSPSAGHYRRGCRHPDCRAAQAESVRAYRGGGERRPPQRGTRSCYVNNRCSHPECRAANSRYQAERGPTRWRPRWRPEDEAVLRANDDDETAAVLLGRSVDAVRRRRKQLTR